MNDEHDYVMDEVDLHILCDQVIGGATSVQREILRVWIDQGDRRCAMQFVKDWNCGKAARK